MSTVARHLPVSVRVLLFGWLLLALPSCLPVTQAAPRPNIVVIMTDDQTLESLRVMPQTQSRLGMSTGTTFRNFFVSQALCCPSRATFLTGQYSHNHRVVSNEAPTGGYTKLNHTNTLAVWLQQAGYYTVHLGKYLNEYGLINPIEVPPGWTDWQGLVHPPTLQYGYTINDNSALVHFQETSWGIERGSSYGQPK